MYSSMSKAYLLASLFILAPFPRSHHQAAPKALVFHRARDTFSGDEKRSEGREGEAAEAEEAGAAEEAEEPAEEPAEEERRAAQRPRSGLFFFCCFVCFVLFFEESGRVLLFSGVCKGCTT